MNVKPLLILILLFSFLLSVGISRAGVSGSTFKVYVEDTGSIGFQSSQDHNVSLTVSSGTLNSSESILSMEYRKKRGTFICNSSSPWAVTVDYSNETLYLKTQVNDEEWTIRSEEFAMSLSADDKLAVYWTQRILNPFDQYVNLWIGLAGLGLMVLSSFFVARKARDFGGPQDLTVLGISFVGIIIGAGLIIVWLW